MSSKTKTTATKEEATPALVPKLRFPEFRRAEGWPQQQLGSVATFFKGKGLPKSALTPDGKRPCIHYGELFTVYPEVIGAVKSRTNSEEDVFLSVENDVLMPTSDVTPSGLAKACCLNFENVILGGDILVIRTDRRSINGEFLARYIRHLERKVLQLVSGSTVFHLYASSMEKLVLSFPQEPAEQQKIAECLSSVDELIAAQARNLDALKTHKKGLMQQLFPREGETQPRLRFPEFQNAGEWGDDKLGSVCELYQPVTLTASDLTMTGEYFVYGANGIIGSHDVYNHEESEIAVTCRGATCGEVTVTKPKSWITGNAMIVKPRTKKLRKDFIFHYFKNHGLKAIISGSAQPQITRTGFAPLVVFFPKPDEQQRIADCLTSLDDLISAQTQKLAALKTHKKGLMQQLFPSPDTQQIST
jgi:type I restriction enzyme, S subunit